jgi:hypothetical protein
MGVGVLLRMFNIRKIILEEVNDFNWIGELPPDTLVPGAIFEIDGRYNKRVPDDYYCKFVITHVDVENNEVVDYVLESNDEDNPVGKFTEGKYVHAKELVDNGHWNFVGYNSSLNESEDFDWIRNVDINPREFLPGNIYTWYGYGDGFFHDVPDKIIILKREITDPDGDEDVLFTTIPDVWDGDPDGAYLKVLQRDWDDGYITHEGYDGDLFDYYKYKYQL